MSNVVRPQYSVGTERLRLASALLVIPLFGPSLLWAAEGYPPPPEGERLAQQVCSACHIVAQKQDRDPILKDGAPSFCEIANRPRTTAQSVAHFVLTTHWDEKSAPVKMPDPMLNKDQAAAVSRYVISLRGRCTF
jgi:mono/diheme cytochrome c family protein